jgi:hypothetical protein
VTAEEQHLARLERRGAALDLAFDDGQRAAVSAGRKSISRSRVSVWRLESSANQSRLAAATMFAYSLPTLSSGLTSKQSSA